MKKLILAATLLASTAHAADPCQLATQTQTTGTAVVTHSRVVEQTVLNLEWGWRTCRIRMQAQHADTVVEGQGEYTWNNGWPNNEGCYVARERARVAIQEQIGQLTVTNRQVLTCNDAQVPAAQPQVWTKYSVWYTAPLWEFPLYNQGRRPFSHRSYPGSTCLQFLNHLGRIGGTICQTRDGLWTVVDILDPHQLQYHYR